MNTKRPVHSLVDIAPTIAELTKTTLPDADGVVIPELMASFRKCHCERVVLIIIDSLDYPIYQKLEGAMPHVHGIIIKCKSVASHTTPAIASILTGCYPATHRILATADVLTSPIKSLLERAVDSNISAAIVIESKGADAMRTKIDLVEGVADSDDILDYDTKIKQLSLNILKKKPVITAIHFRAIDRYAHEERSFRELATAAECIDRHLSDIIEASGSDACVIICGDHPIHAKHDMYNTGKSDQLFICLLTKNEV
ncbi:MAG: hypothetical protein AEth_00079 [Candidatus Argoarchaeum ethanivorans]|uniref:Metalloenzyme domain-containing protein n=1 Tax=Candidatus Argoarchaeum ethanivorans TaxID=2608793 RepID=A0A8B3S753_9EURY|nr:MAG: hypothetical protein AEth_00079 [Candidatus Argoarchaeum ethanivorans]